MRPRHRLTSFNRSAGDENSSHGRLALCNARNDTTRFILEIKINKLEKSGISLGCNQLLMVDMQR